VTSLAEAETRPRRRGSGERGDRKPTWPRIAIVAAVFVFAFFVARSCQQDQVRISEEQAVAIAEDQVDFEPEHVQIRLLRQGLSSSPFWFVVLSVPTPKNENDFAKLVQFRVDANTGEVEDITQREARQRKPRQKQR
jgi:Peptidase propeptide and YPEB domain